MKTLNCKDSITDKAEAERYKQAKELIETNFFFSCENKPGEFIKRFSKKFPRLSEFKSHHFNHRIK